jgi:hypothetical protein
MNVELVVVQPFGDRARGEVVTDPAEIARVLATNPHHVVKRAAAPAAPVPPQAPAQAGEEH